MSKFKLESSPTGVIFCHVYSDLSKIEALQIAEGIEKLIRNGKTHIVVVFARNATGGEFGLEFLEKALLHLKALASKMGGNIELQVDSEELKNEPSVDPEKEAQKKEIAILRSEILLLKAKLDEFAQYMTKPSSDEDLKKAVLFYQNLAMETPSPSLPKKP